MQPLSGAQPSSLGHRRSRHFGAQTIFEMIEMGQTIGQIRYVRRDRDATP